MVEISIDPQLAPSLRRVIDPEIGLDVLSLGLVYSAQVGGPRADVRMTVTAPGCPSQAELSDRVSDEIRKDFPGVFLVQVDVVEDPPWTPDMMSPEAKRSLGWKDGDGTLMWKSNA